MIDRILVRLIAFAQNSRWSIPAIILGSGMLSAYALTVPLDFSFSGVMDRSHPEVERYFTASERYGLGGYLPVLIEGPEERLDDAVQALREALDARSELRSVDRPIPDEWLLSNAPWLIDSAELEDWRLASILEREPASHVGTEDRSALAAAEIGRMRARFTPPAPSGLRLLQLVMARDTFEMALDSEDFPMIRRLTLEALEPYGAVGHFAGMPAIVTQEQEATIDRMRLLGPASLALVLILLLSVERRLLILASVAVPMLLAIGSTLGVIGLATGKLTLMESIFGVMVFGLGIDFAVHLLLRVRDETAPGIAFDLRLRRAFLGTGRGVVAGGLTTAGAFTILAFAPDPVFYRLGLAGGLGLSLCLVFLFLMLPAQWAWIEKRSPSPIRRGSSIVNRALVRCAALSVRRPIVALSLGSLLFAVGLGAGRSLLYETNLERVFSRDIEAVETARQIQVHFGLHPGVWMATARNVSEARALVNSFEADPLFQGTQSVVALLPEDVETRRRELSAIASEILGVTRAAGLSLEMLAESVKEAPDINVDIDIDPDAGRLSRTQLLLAAHEQGPPSLESLPDNVRERLIGPDGEIIIFASTTGATLDSDVAAKERHAAQAIAPEATSMNAIYEALIGTDRPWLPPIMASVLGFVLLVVRLDLGTFRATLLALVPVVFSMGVTFGIYSALGFSVNTVTLVAVPLLLGLGVDDGIHVVHRMFEQPEEPLERVVGAVSTSITLTTVTTCASVSLLLFSRHPGIESVAILLLIGLPAALLATVLLVPATAVLMNVTGVRS